jgi:uncharacterized protein (DUF488 family)
MSGSSTQFQVLTIGHSVHTFEFFCSLLQKNQVEVVADVRSSPFSRFNPHFNREPLKKSLAARSVGYVFLGRELGARSQDRANYIGQQVSYELLAASPLFNSGIQRVQSGAIKYRVALLCAEKDPIECHRALLVGRALEKGGIQVNHIRADGSVESSEAFLARVFEISGVSETDMFHSRNELIEEAFKRQGMRVAYVDEHSEEELSG